MLQGCDTVRVTEATEDLLQRYVSMYIYIHMCHVYVMACAPVCSRVLHDVFVHVEVVVVVVVVVHDVMLSQ